MAPLGLGYFVYAEIRERRKEKATTTSLPTEAPTPTTAPTKEQRLADRYGGNR